MDTGDSRPVTGGGEGPPGRPPSAKGPPHPHLVVDQVKHSIVGDPVQRKASQPLLQHLQQLPDWRSSGEQLGRKDHTQGRFREHPLRQAWPPRARDQACPDPIHRLEGEVTVIHPAVLETRAGVSPEHRRGGLGGCTFPFLQPHRCPHARRQAHSHLIHHAAKGSGGLSEVTADSLSPRASA